MRDRIIPAISLWQPWASLLVMPLAGDPLHAEKQIETRDWPTNVRGMVAIHAAKRNIKLEADDDAYFYVHRIAKDNPLMPKEMQMGPNYWSFPIFPRGAIVGITYIIACVPIKQLYGTKYDTPEERALGNWSPSRYGWICERPHMFDRPIPCVGKQGFFRWEFPGEGGNLYGP